MQLKKALISAGVAALMFGAMATTAVAAAPNWDTTGSYVVNFNYSGTDYAHDMTLAQTGGAITGVGGGYPAGGAHTYTWVVDSGTVDGDSVSFTAHYTASADAVTPLTTMNVVGTIANDGTMFGTWSDNYQGGSRTGTWATASGTADPISIPACGSDNTTFDTFTLGSVNGQHGWVSTGPYDQEIVNNTYGYPTFGCKSLRISNAVTSGSFGDQTFSYSVANEAGETDALNNGMSGGTRQNHFEAQFDFASTMLAQQPGLFMSVSPDRGDGARMSYLGFTDSPAGIDVNFFDVQGTTDPANFVGTVVATGLSRTATHTAKFVIDFVDGPSNDVVKIYIDGVLVHTGTTWENYYRFDDESNPGLAQNNSRTVDSLLFRVGGAAVLANSGNGYLLDNVSLISSSTPPPPVDPKDACKNGGWKNFTNPSFKNQGQCIQFVNTGK